MSLPLYHLNVTLHICILIGIMSRISYTLLFTCLPCFHANIYIKKIKTVLFRNALCIITLHVRAPHANSCTNSALAISMLPTLCLFLGACHIFMQAVEVNSKEEELFEVEFEYASAAVKTAQALEDWWKESPSNPEVLKEFFHILYVRLNACFVCCWSTLQFRKERMWGSYHHLGSAETFVCS